MKKLLLIALLALPMSLSAQKFAHFDFTAIMQAMPEFKTAQTELEALGKQYQTELESLQAQLKTEYEKMQKEIDDTTPEQIRTRRIQNFQEMQEKYEQAEQDFTNEFSQKRQAKFEPIQQKVMNAVDAVAKENAYVYVMDSNAAQAAGIYINEAISEDATAKVKAKLGL